MNHGFYLKTSDSNYFICEVRTYTTVRIMRPCAASSDLIGAWSVPCILIIWRSAGRSRNCHAAVNGRDICVREKKGIGLWFGDKNDFLFVVSFVKLEIANGTFLFSVVYAMLVVPAHVVPVVYQ
ncbi:MAG: hypothetical protein QM786_04460 [Breznakibacter sp.]